MMCKLPPNLQSLEDYDKCLRLGRTSCHIKRRAALKDLKSKYSIIGAGHARTTFDIGNGCVLKYGGLHISNMELAVWNCVKNTELAEYFVPIDNFTNTGAWLLMPMVKTRFNKSRRVIIHPSMEDYHRAKDFLRSKGLECDDLTYDNIGIHDGKPKFFDYESCYITLRKKGEI